MRACCGCAPRRPRTSSRMARRRPGTHNARRRFVGVAGPARAGGRVPGPARPERRRTAPDEAPTPEEQKDLAQRLRRVPEVGEALDRMWPRLSPHEFLHDLLGARPLLAAAGKGILSPPEVQRLYRPRSASLDAVPWTVGRRRAHRRGAHPARPPPGPSGPGPGAAGRGGHGVGGGVLAPGAGGLARARRPAPSTGVRGRDPRLRPHRGGRGAGPLADAAAHAGPPLALGLHDRGGRHRAGHRALGARRAGTTSRAT